MSQTFDRDQAIVLATIPTGTAVSNAINYRDFATGGFIMPGAWTAAAIAFKVSSDGITFQPLKVAAGTLLELATGAINEARPLPAELAGFAFFQFWSETAGADTNQAADRVLQVHLKS